MYQQHGTWRLLQAVCFVEEWNRERRGKGEPLISFVDISQTVTRMAQSTEDTKVPNSDSICCNYVFAATSSVDIKLLTWVSTCFSRFWKFIKLPTGDGSMPIDKIWGLTSIDKLMVHGFDPQPERYLCWLLLIEIYEFPVLDWSIYQVPDGFPLDVYAPLEVCMKWKGKERKGRNTVLFVVV